MNRDTPPPTSAGCDGRRTRRALLCDLVRLSSGLAGLVLLGGCAVSPGREPGVAPASRIATVGYLSASAPDEAAEAEASPLDWLRRGLRELGWAEGENLRLEVRSARGDASVLPDLAAELVRLPVDVLVTLAGPPVSAAAPATRTLPIVMVNGPSDAVERGLAASIQRPGGNVTGNVRAPNEIWGKRLEQLLEAVPHVSRVAYLGTVSPSYVGPLDETARALGVELFRIPSPESEREVELAFEAIGHEAADALLVDDNNAINLHRTRIIDFAAQRRLPAMYLARRQTAAGGLMSYDASRAAMARRAATYVDRILRGTKPGDLPIEFPTEYELIINLKTAAALGLSIPDSLLAQATEVIR